MIKQIFVSKFIAACPRNARRYIISDMIQRKIEITSLNVITHLVTGNGAMFTLGQRRCGRC